MVVSSVVVNVVDTGVIGSGFYGFETTLTNGIFLKKLSTSGGELIDLTAGEAVIVNYDWARFCFDFQTTNFKAGKEFTQAKCEMKYPIELTTGQKLGVILNDDFSDLDEHRFYVEGYIK